MSKAGYTDHLRIIKSLLIVTSLQKRKDIKAIDAIRKFSKPLSWKPLKEFMIDADVWKYAVKKGYDPKEVFCHPDVLIHNPTTSLYYRGLCGLSVKAAKSYFGTIESLEEGNSRSQLAVEKAQKMACIYNFFICSIIKNSTDWSIENGYRTIIATLGITLDGSMRNKIGRIAEDRIRAMIVEWLAEKKLVVEQKTDKKRISDKIQRTFELKNGVIMEFSSEPDISFTKEKNLLAVVEIKGGIDPAGALERYGAATKSFQHAIATSSRCKNFYLGAVFTPELERRISEDRLVEKTFNIIEILDDPAARERFFTELFHHVLRMV